MRPGISLFAVATFVAAGSVLSPPPSNSQGVADCDAPCGFDLVGTTASGTADSHGTFSMVVRDSAHNLLPGVDVSIDFSACFDIHIATVHPDPAVTVTCSNGATVVHKKTDANGVVTFSLVGSARLQGLHEPGAGFKCATVRASGGYCGGVIGTVNVGAYDLNGVGGVNPADISLIMRPLAGTGGNGTLM